MLGWWKAMFTGRQWRARALAAAFASGGTLLFGAAGALASAAAPVAVTAPGRVIFSVDGGIVSGNVDGGGATAAVALPDGGAVLIGSGNQQETGFYAARLTSAGALDQSFGTGGVVRVGGNTAPTRVEQIVRQSDGKLVVVGDGVATNKRQSPPLVLVRLNQDGSTDQSFGGGGVAQLPIQDPCGGCAPLAMLPNGGFIVTGNTGERSRAQDHDPKAVPNTQWVVVRLTAAGALDPGFGQSGIATVAGAGGSGSNAAVLGNGDIVTFGGAVGGNYLARLLPSGAPDPAFNAGNPASVTPGFGLGMIANPDGSVIVAVRGAVVRYTNAGVPDPGFGPGGSANIPLADFAQILPAAAAGVLVATQSFARPGEVQVERLAANGAVDPALGGPTGQHLVVPFGGGGSTFLVSKRLIPTPPLVQNSFRDTTILARPDGSYLIVGGVRVSQPTGEGQGKSIFDVAAAALTPSFTLATGFGGPATPLHASLRVAAQKAATSLTRHGIRVQVNLSAPGLCLVVIKAGGRVVARSVLPVFASGPVTLPVELTAFGNHWLRLHHRVRLSVTAAARDLLTNTATATGSGTLH